MKTTKKQLELLSAMKAGKLDNQSQQNLLFKILNMRPSSQPNQEAQTNLELLQAEIKSIFQSSDFEGFELSNEQSLKAFDWLKALWITPTGAERKNNPFRYREQAAIENFERVSLKGYYDAGNYYYSYYVPLYDVYAKDGYGFEYHINGGSISITG